MSLGYLREQVNYDNKLDDKAMRYHAEGVTERLLGVGGEDVYRVAPAYLYFKKNKPPMHHFWAVPGCRHLSCCP